MSLSRRQRKESLKIERNNDVHELEKYDAILQQDLGIIEIVRGRNIETVPERDKNMIKRMMHVRRTLISTLPEDDRSIGTMSIPKRVKHLKEIVIPTITNKIQQKDATIKNLGSFIGNIKRSLTKKGGRTLRKKKGGRKSLKKRRKQRKSIRK
jgi:hypothetical protein